jgi:hypothetical protein
MGNATKGTELYVKTKDEKGALAKCTVTLRENNINIEAVCAYGMDGDANFMFITNDNSKAKKLLTDGGYAVEENEVVWWKAGNTPGTLNKATAALAEKGVNINYMYGSGGTGNTNAWIALNTNNNDETWNTLNNF